MRLPNHFVVFLLIMASSLEGAARIKELAALEGVRDNQLVGYGLVVGLAGTGDKRQTVFSAQTVANVLERMGITVSPTAIQVRNTAVVLLSATLPPYSQPGTRIDVTAAAMGDATNLQGGILVLTPLKGPDGQSYAAAQGPVVTGGFVAGRGGNSQTTNHPTTARVPSGAIVERPSPSPPLSAKLRLQVRSYDFTTAARIAAAINAKFPSDHASVARADSAGLVSVMTPAEYAGRTVEFVAAIENLTVEVDRMLRIVVNERTGTVVFGKEVQIAPVAILQGSLTVEIRTSLETSQPNPLSAGQTTTTPQTSVSAKESPARNVILRQGATVEDLVRALLAIGSTPRDVIAILQNLKAAGALNAELEVI